MHAADHALPLPAQEATAAPISFHDLWPYALLALALLTLVYFVVLDEGALSLIPGRFIHELAHDGRHLISAPCH